MNTIYMNTIYILTAVIIVAAVLFYVYDTNKQRESESDFITPYVYASGFSSSNATAVAIGLDAVSSSEKEAKVYGKRIPKNASVVAYLNGNKLMVKEIRSDKK